MGGTPLYFQAVLFIGSTSKDLFPIASEDLVHPLLPVGNRALLLYSLQNIRNSNIGSVLLGVSGETLCSQIRNWLADSYQEKLHVEVFPLPEDCESAHALRLLSPKLKAQNILVLSFDLVTNFPLGSLAAAHRRQNASMTALLYRPSGSHVPEGSKEKSKKSVAGRICVGVDHTGCRLLYVSSGIKYNQNVSLRRSILRSAGEINFHTDLLDAHAYAFKTEALLQALESNPPLTSVLDDVLPHFVHLQHQSHRQQPPAAAATPPGIPRSLSVNEHGSQAPLEAARCFILVAPSSYFCSRVTSLPSYAAINHDIVGDALPLTGYQLSAHNNVVHPSTQLGNKSTIGPQCIVGEDVVLADKCSVKRSVIGPHCKLATGVKVTNSVLLESVSIGDGSVIQNSILAPGVVLQDNVSLKDCYVGSGFLVGSGKEHKSESLARREL